MVHMRVIRGKAVGGKDTYAEAYGTIVRATRARKCTPLLLARGAAAAALFWGWS